MAANTWREAIITVLTESGGPLHYADIAERILNQELYKTDGATPANTVSRIITSSIREEGERSPFMRVRMGEYSLQAKPADERTLKVEEKDSNIVFSAFGMYWERAWVDWKGRPALWGKQNEQAAKVDFSKQIGLYVLYDGHRAIYAGRATSESLGARLLYHTKGRMASRWNRFSWFGLSDVNEDGTLTTPVMPSDLEQLVAAIEALLIELLETPLNRKRGDYIGGLEYLQEEDPQLADARMVQRLMTMMRSSG